MTSHPADPQVATLPETSTERFDADVVEASRTRPVVDRLLAAVADPATREPARQALIEVFNVLGDDHELTRRARPRLAAALY